MNVCRAFWTGLVSLLLPMLSAGPASSAPGLPEQGVLRYFHYWSEYGEQASRPGGLEHIRFELQREKVFFSQGRPMPDTFSASADGSLNRELVPVLAALDLADWPGQMAQAEVRDLPDRKKRKLCRWHLCAIFEPEVPGTAPLEVCIDGTDDGSSPKRLAAEQAFRNFFGPKLEALKAATPRHIASLLWLTHDASYDFRVEKNGMVVLERRKGSERRRLCLYPGFVEELGSLVRASGLEKHHGFFQRAHGGAQGFSFGITFDTRQRIEVVGHSGAGGTPEGFPDALAPLLRAMDDAMDLPAGKVLPTALESFSFRISGMRAGVEVHLYARMDKDGPVLVLSRIPGHAAERRQECVLDAAQIAGLEALLERNAVRSWNGFEGRPYMDVLDGESFHLSLAFRDGTQVSASGENEFPAGYQSFCRELRLYADKVLGPQE